MMHNFQFSFVRFDVNERGDGVKVDWPPELGLDSAEDSPRPPDDYSGYQYNHQYDRCHEPWLLVEWDVCCDLHGLSIELPI